MGAYIVGGDADRRDSVRAIRDDAGGRTPIVRCADGPGRGRGGAFPSGSIRRHGGPGAVGNLQLPVEARTLRTVFRSVRREDAAGAARVRSEERRVGEEGRSWWS